mgnify:FL=1
MIKEEIMKNFFQCYGMATSMPKMKNTPNGNVVCNFKICICEDRQDSEYSRLIYIRVEAWDQVAKECVEKIKEGSLCAILDGKLKRNFYKTTSKTGEHYVHDGLIVVAKKIEIIEDKEDY